MHESARIVRFIRAEETHTLRQRVLRPFQEISQMVYAGDDDADTVHFGAFMPTGELAAVASLYRAKLSTPHFSEATHDGHAWQFRGVASAPEFRGAGFGGKVQRAIIAHVRARAGRVLWCNARVSAVWFYEHFGMRVVSEPFDIPRIGPHVVMVGEMADLAASVP